MKTTTSIVSKSVFAAVLLCIGSTVVAKDQPRVGDRPPAHPVDHRLFLALKSKLDHGGQTGITATVVTIIMAIGVAVTAGMAVAIVTVAIAQ